MLDLHTAAADIPESFGTRGWSHSAKPTPFWTIDFRKLPTGEQPFRQRPSGLKSDFHGDRCIRCFKKKACIPMPIFNYFAVVGSALLLLIFASDAYFGDHESNSRFNGSLSESAIYAPRLEKSLITTGLQFTRDATPVDHVKEVFAQFVPNEIKRGKRYSPPTPDAATHSSSWVTRLRTAS